MSTATQPVVTTPVKSATGDFVWYELRTTDAKGAEDFYTHVVGWKTLPSGDPGGIPYTLFSIGDFSVAGVMQLSQEMLAGGMVPSWAGFIGVDDVDGYAEKVQGAGGKMHCPAQDIPGVGRWASVEDPQGVAFMLFKGNREAPQAPPPGTPGTVGWHELSANDGEAAWQFYSQTFGWNEDSSMDMGPMGTYRMFNNGGPMFGGMMTRDQSKSPVPFWLFYLAVEDIDAALTRIQEKKGQVFVGPHEVPGGSFIVIGADPQGAMFAVVGPRKQDS